MARATTSGGWSHASDAGFRAWVAEIEQLLDDAGLVRTSDTGQIDTATVVRPASNTNAGYSIWRFDDSLQATAPIFIKCWFGTGGGTTLIRFGIEVGTGSNGSGTLTGLTTTSSVNTSGASIGAGTYSSYAIHREGLAALAFKVGGGASSSVSTPGFIVQRSNDNTGAPNADGAVVIVPSDNFSSTSYGRFTRLRFLPTTESSGMITSQWLGQVPGAITDARVGLSPQVFPHWTMHPKMIPLIGSAAHIRGEIAVGQQYSMTLVGSAPRNYLSVGWTFGNTLYSPAATDTSILWED